MVFRRKQFRSRFNSTHLLRPSLTETELKVITQYFTMSLTKIAIIGVSTHLRDSKTKDIR